MKRILFVLSLFLLATLTGCPKPLPVPPGPDSEVGVDATTDDGDDAGAGVEDTTAPVLDDAKSSVTLACAQLRKLHCPEGDQADGGQTCEALMQHVVNTKLTSVNPTCIAKAATVSAARACSPTYVKCGAP